MVTAQQVDPKPGPGWNPQGALNLPDTWFLVEKHMPSGFPMSVAIFVTICFEETACCNIVQNGAPVGIGPGQMQVSEIGGVAFFASENNFMGGQWDSSMTMKAVRQDRTTFWRQKRLHPTLPELTKEMILADNEFAIKMHVKWLQWLSRGYGMDGKPMGLGGLLAAQTGNNLRASQLFKEGAGALAKLMQPDPKKDLRWSDAEWKTFFAKRRKEFMIALNIARQFRGNEVPESHEKFWEFFLPDGFLQSPLGYIKWGF